MAEGLILQLQNDVKKLKEDVKKLKKGTIVISGEQLVEYIQEAIKDKIIIIPERPRTHWLRGPVVKK